jgi:4'-phosphopantetheinyl transferase
VSVELWLADLGDERWPGPEGLPEPERERAERFARGDLGRRWAAARWALRTVLGTSLGEDPAAVRIQIATGGKPRLAGAGPRFNLSHSGEVALIALSPEVEVGVDVERVDPHRDVLALAPQALAGDALAGVLRAPPERRIEEFYAAWTRREARAKCSGEGLGGAGGATDRLVVVDLAGPPGYAAALALAAAEVPAIRWRRAAPPR